MPDHSRDDHRRTILRVALFTAAYILAASAAAVLRGNREFVFYIAVMVLLAAAVYLVDRRIRFSPLVLWGLSLWGLAHMAGGLVPVPESWPISGEIRVLYSWWIIPGLLKYDHVVHAYGFGVTTRVCWEGLQSILRGRGIVPVRPTAGMLVLCGAASLGFGALNEIVEFAAVLLVPETNVGGYYNTGWDLVSNLAGVLIAMAAIASSAQRERGDSSPPT